MSDQLEQAAASRSQLPTFGQPGDSLPTQLDIAQRSAQQRLAKYIGQFRYTPEQAEVILHQVQSWAERERPSLISVLNDPSSQLLPEDLRLELGIEQTKQFVIASYSMATRTLGPWTSGLVGELVAGGELTEPEMRADARARLAVFGAIVQWDEDGDLEMIFNPAAAKPMTGLGSPLSPVIVGGIIVAAVIALVATAALVLHWMTSLYTIRRNADLMDRLCSEAEKKGDQQRTAECLRRSYDLQTNELSAPNIVSQLVVGGVVLSLVYVGVVHLLPALSAAWDKRKATAS